MKTQVKSVAAILKTIVLGFAILTVNFFYSCTDDKGVYIAGEVEHLTPANAQAFQALRQEALQNLTQNFQVSVSSSYYLTFTSAGNADVTINAACLHFNGVSLQEGDVVDIEFVELYNRGNLLSTNIATMGEHPNGDLSMLITGGAFYLNLSKDGIALDEDVNCHYEMLVPASNTGGLDEEMVFWYGEIDEFGDLVWELVENDTRNEDGVFFEGENYYVWSSKFAWTNVDRFYNDDRDKTTLLVDVPEGYTYENSAVYLSYDGELGLARLDTYDEDTGYFSEHYGQIPIGLDLHLIFVSESDGDWVYAIKPVTIQANHVIQVDPDTLDTTTEEDLTQMINALP